MKCGKPKGCKSYRDGKLVAEETLPSRLSKATITGGDLMQRMSSNYSKKATKASEMGLGSLFRGFM